MWKCPKCGRSFQREGQDHYCGEAPATIADYINMQPEQVQPYLRQVNEIIKSALPQAISNNFLFSISCLISSTTVSVFFTMNFLLVY